MTVAHSENPLLEYFEDTLPAPVAAAVEELAKAGGIEARGAVFTRPEVVEFILDLSGYTTDLPLHQRQVLEPACGGGDFLAEIVRRAISSWRSDPKSGNAAEDLRDAVRAVELHRPTFVATKARIRAMLNELEIPAKDISTLLKLWLIQGDFLLTEFAGQFDFIVGNPPYVRQELIPEVLLVEYRRRYSTVYDRADLYVPFIERSLFLLAKSGALGLICSDRWMKNKYGGPLRRVVHEAFCLKAFVDMVDAASFLSEVVAYPAITVVTRERRGPTRIARCPRIERSSLSALATAMKNNQIGAPFFEGEVEGITSGSDPWLLDSPKVVSVLRKIEARFPILEQTGCKVGIGVATGADKVFVGDFDDLDVEDEHKLPLVTTRCISTGEVIWTGKGVINPYTEDGQIVDLQSRPRLRRYFESRREPLENRHCAKKSPKKWYRTIDKIHPHLTTTPKLLIPDIKGKPNIAYDPGRLYPHHNLYYIVSDDWDLRALQAVLLSSVTRLFIGMYSTKMRGGFLRFQAQHLRRLRLPLWSDVSERLRLQLISAATDRLVDDCDEVTAKLYGLSDSEMKVVKI